MKGSYAMKKIVAILLILIMCAGIVSAAADDGYCVVRIPASIQGLTYRVYVNGIPTKADDTELVGGNAYTVKRGSDVKIVFSAVPGYELVGADSVTIKNIQSDTSVRVPQTVREGQSFSLAERIAQLFTLIRNNLKTFFGSILGLVLKIDNTSK